MQVPQLEKYLLEAEGKEQNQMAKDNFYRELGFDGNQKRLGWVRTLPFDAIKKALEEIKDVLEGKEVFIFIGMGGSVNGIKPLLTFFSNGLILTLDSLDPQAVKEIISKIINPNKTLVIPISKSGSTKETQLLAQTLKEFFINQGLEDGVWQKQFLWLADSSAMEKLDSLGWKGVRKANIQCDKESDIGGRFTSPTTFVFLLPLFLLLKKDMHRLESLYKAFLAHKGLLREQAVSYVEKYAQANAAYFSPVIEKMLLADFTSWLAQLFQESLGGKRSDFYSVKTLVVVQEPNPPFLPIKLELNEGSPIVRLMCEMYFFQIFVALYAGVKAINFVNQPCVEEYKKQMRQLEGEKVEGVEVVDRKGLMDRIEAKLKPTDKFIDLVCYFHPKGDILEELRQCVSKNFPGKEIFISIGSDWNHHSYQAAFTDPDSLYILLLADSYLEGIEGVSREQLIKNINALRLISKATYVTMKDKSLFLALMFTEVNKEV